MRVDYSLYEAVLTGVPETVLSRGELIV